MAPTFPQYHLKVHIHHPKYYFKEKKEKQTKKKKKAITATDGIG